MCLANRSSILFLPCRHISVCTECANRLPDETCPLCRAPIEHMIDAYISWQSITQNCTLFERLLKCKINKSLSRERERKCQRDCTICTYWLATGCEIFIFIDYRHVLWKFELRFQWNNHFLLFWEPYSNPPSNKNCENQSHTCVL